MPHYSEKRIVPFTGEQMFALVADVERYPEFLPWCVATRVRARSGEEFTADLVAAFGAFREQYTSRVRLDPSAMTIVIDYLDGPFQHLHNNWTFRAIDQGCEIDFDIDFKFKSKALDALISKFFTRAIEKMTASFEARAFKLYASPSDIGAG